MSEFRTAFYRTCPVHKPLEYPIWRKCPKCSEVITYSEDEVKVFLSDFFDRYTNAQSADINGWFEEHKKK